MASRAERKCWSLHYDGWSSSGVTIIAFGPRLHDPKHVEANLPTLDKINVGSGLATLFVSRGRVVQLLAIAVRLRRIHTVFPAPINPRGAGPLITHFSGFGLALKRSTTYWKLGGLSIKLEQKWRDPFIALSFNTNKHDRRFDFSRGVELRARRSRDAPRRMYATQIRIRQRFLPINARYYVSWLNLNYAGFLHRFLPETCPHTQRLLF